MLGAAPLPWTSFLRFAAGTAVPCRFQLTAKEPTLFCILAAARAHLKCLCPKGRHRHPPSPTGHFLEKGFSLDLSANPQDWGWRPGP